MNLLTIQQAADVAKVSKPTIRSWMDSGKVKSTRLGSRTVRILEADLLAYVHAQYQAPRPKKEKPAPEEVAQSPEQPLEPVSEPPQEQPAEAPQEPAIAS